MIEIRKFPEYSRGKWRIVIDGEQLYGPEEINGTIVSMPVCAETKQDIVDKMLALLVKQNERIKQLTVAISRVFEAECSDYPNKDANSIDQLWAIEQALAGRRLALLDMHSEMREGYKTL